MESVIILICRISSVNNKLFLEVNNNGIIDKLESNYVLKSSIYNHIVVTYNNNKLGLFINGDKVEKTVNYSITINNSITMTYRKPAIPPQSFRGVYL